MSSTPIKINNKIILFYIIGFILILLAWQKPFDFAPDTYQYISLLNIPYINYDISMYEPFHWLIIYINSVFFDAQARSFLFIYACLFVLIGLYSVYKYSVYPIISLIIFALYIYPNYGLVQLRAGIAVCIFLMSINDIIEKKIGKYYIKAALAILFHYSAIIIIPLYFINALKINKYIYILIPIICLIAGRYITPENILFITAHLPPVFGGKLYTYLHIMEFESKYININRINIFNFYSISMTSIYYYILTLNRSDARYNIYLNVMAIGLIFWYTFVNLPVLSFRYSNFFLSVVVLLIPIIVDHYKNKYNIKIIIIIYFMVLFYFLYYKQSIFKWELIF